MLEHLLSLSLIAGMVVTFVPVNNALNSQLQIEEEYVVMNRLLEEETERFLREGTIKYTRTDGGKDYFVTVSMDGRNMEAVCVSRLEKKQCITATRVYPT